MPETPGRSSAPAEQNIGILRGLAWMTGFLHDARTAEKLVAAVIAVR